jgi:hypothetical protein
MGEVVKPGPLPPEIASQDVARAGVAPDGYMVARHAVPHEIADRCKALLGMPYGHEEYRESDEGVSYFMRVEPHWWFGADPSKPSHWHKGVTVYSLTEFTW